MKILTDKEHSDLQLAAGANAPLMHKIDYLEKELVIEKDTIKKLHIQKEGLERDLQNQEKDHEIEIRRKNAQQDVIVADATKELRTKVEELTISEANWKNQAEMLQKAFENLGFDVKDMKDVLNKLVDGLVSKNEIKVISASK